MSLLCVPFIHRPKSGVYIFEDLSVEPISSQSCLLFIISFTMSNISNSTATLNQLLWEAQKTTPQDLTVSLGRALSYHARVFTDLACSFGLS